MDVDGLREDARAVVRELGLLKDAFFDIGVTLAERHLLIELASGKPRTMKEVGERLLIEKSTASRLIARAIKKGYITTTSDENDRRRRYLHLTALGKKTLHSFEKIAFRQTKEALLALSPQEVELVEAGVKLYAKGLKACRLNEKTPAATYPFLQGYLLSEYVQEDDDALHQIFQEVAGMEGYFPNESTTFLEYQYQFFGRGSKVYVCKETSTNEVVGSFYIKPNCPGRCDHIANAAYMIKESHRSKGIGTKLLEASLALAKEQGFLAMQFNMVLSDNTGALKLYKKMGFETIGTIPDAIRNSDGTYQDGYILYKRLT